MDEKPPVDKKYEEALANQKAGVSSKSEKRYTFEGKRPDGIVMIFFKYGETLQNATHSAYDFCKESGIEFLGRVANFGRKN